MGVVQRQPDKAQGRSARAGVDRGNRPAERPYAGGDWEGPGCRRANGVYILEAWLELELQARFSGKDSAIAARVSYRRGVLAAEARRRKNPVGDRRLAGRDRPSPQSYDRLRQPQRFCGHAGADSESLGTRSSAQTAAVSWSASSRIRVQARSTCRASVLVWPP